MKEKSKLQTHGNEIKTSKDNIHSDWWMAENVCEMFEIEDTERAIAELNPDEKQEAEFRISGDAHKAVVVNLKGMLSLLFQSKSAETDKFKSQVKRGKLLGLLLENGGGDITDLCFENESEEARRLHFLFWN